VLDNEFRDMLANGQIKWNVGEISAFESGGVEVKDIEGERVLEGKYGGGSASIDADVVIYGTGFGKDYSIFDPATQEKLSAESDGLYLFRHTVDTSHFSYFLNDLAAGSLHQCID